MPTRDSATSAHSPDSTMSTGSAQASSASASAVSALSPGTSADSSANLPMKVDSGGRPATSSVQQMKARPSSAVAAGMA